MNDYVACISIYIYIYMYKLANQAKQTLQLQFNNKNNTK